MDTDSSIVNIVQSSGELSSDLTYNSYLKEDDLMRQSERPKNVKSNKFNIYSIVAAALVFISIIAIFEIIRLYMEHLAASDAASRIVLYDRTIGQLYYSLITIVITIIGLVTMKYYKLI